MFAGAATGIAPGAAADGTAGAGTGAEALATPICTTVVQMKRARLENASRTTHPETLFEPQNTKHRGIPQHHHTTTRVMQHAQSRRNTADMSLMDLDIAMVVESSSADVRSSAVEQRQHHRETAGETAGETAPGEIAQRTSVGCQKKKKKTITFLYQGCFSV